MKAQREANPERTASGRVQRASAQVANFHLAEIANNELPKDWPKRKFQSDLVPDDKKAREDFNICLYNGKRFYHHTFIDLSWFMLSFPVEIRPTRPACLQPGGAEEVEE